MTVQGPHRRVQPAAVPDRRGGQEPAPRDDLLLRRLRRARHPRGELEGRVPGAALPGHAADLVRTVHPVARAEAVQPPDRPVRARRHHVEHLLGLVDRPHLPRALRLGDRDAVPGDVQGVPAAPGAGDVHHQPRRRRAQQVPLHPGRLSVAELATWTDGPTKSAIVDFVGRVTAEGPDFVAPEARVAVFDNDGTLWCEKPMYIQLDFIVRRLAEKAAADASLAEQQPYKAAISGDLSWFGGAITKHYQGDDSDLKVLAGAVMSLHESMNVEDHAARVSAFFAEAKHPTLGRPYQTCTYAPMVELLRYLEANGFTCYIVSGGGRDFMRPDHQRDLRHPARTRGRQLAGPASSRARTATATC